MYFFSLHYALPIMYVACWDTVAYDYDRMFGDVVSTDLADNLTYAAQTIDSRNLFSLAHKTALEAFPYFVLAYANCSVSYRHLTQGDASYIHLHPLGSSWACIQAERMA